MVIFQRLGKDNYTKFNNFMKAVDFAEKMSRKSGKEAEVRNYYTEELVYVTEPEINLDKELRI